MFCDASGKAFGACAYLVTPDSSTLVFSKGKVLKQKGASIPTSELEAAKVGAKVAQKLAPILSLSADRVWFWSDSVNALSWIKAPSRKLSYYVARVASFIRDSSNPFHWRYCPTDCNPADLISRGCQARQLADRVLAGSN